jgi:hypothetical protein
MNRVDVEVSGDEETCEAARAANSDDERPAPPLSSSSIDIIWRLFPGRDPLVSDFCDLSQSHRAVANGGVIEPVIPLPGSSSSIQKGHVF